MIPLRWNQIDPRRWNENRTGLENGENLCIVREFLQLEALDLWDSVLSFRQKSSVSLALPVQSACGSDHRFTRGFEGSTSKGARDMSREQGGCLTLI